MRTIFNKNHSEGKVVNFSSALNYRRNWDAPELPYEDCYESIKEIVEEEINKLSADFDIKISTGCLHNHVWKPHQDLVLSSKISKEDSMVLISSVFPNLSTTEKYLIFLTNDGDFHKGYTNDKTNNLDNIFQTYSIEKPVVYKLKKLPKYTGRGSVNIIDDKITKAELKAYTVQFIFHHFKQRNKKFYLGEVINCKASTTVATDMFCFRLDKDELYNNIYISVLTQDFEIISLPDPLAKFWNSKEIKSYPYHPKSEDAKKISIKISDNKKKSLKEEIWNKIQVKGNLVFIHPDTYT